MEAANNRLTRHQRHINTLSLLVAAGFYVVIRFWRVTGDDLWFDEVFSVLTIRQSWAEMFAAVLRDAVHPPLFYILLKCWSLFDSSIGWLQLFPFLISILTLVPLYLFFRELKLSAVEMAVIIAVIAVNNYFLEYALDLRMYGLVQFFTVGSLWSFVRLQNQIAVSRKTILILSLFNLLLVYTHYFGWLIVGLEGLYLIIWKRRFLISFITSSIFVLISFIPWIWLVAQSVGKNTANTNLGWLSRPSFSDVIWFFSVLNGKLYFPHETFINFLVFGFPVAYLIARMLRHQPINENLRLLVFFSFAPVLLVFLLSLILPNSVWESRYLIIAAIPYCVLLISSVFALPNKLLRFIFIAVVLVWSVAAGLYGFSQTPKKIQWSAAAKKIGTAQTPEKPIYVFEDWVGMPLLFYLDNLKIPAQIEKRKITDDPTAKRFWVAKRIANDDGNLDALPFLREKNCRVIEESRYPDAGQTILLFDVECP